MGVIDVDPALLRSEAEAALHAADQSWTHMEAEYAGDIPRLMKTLTPHGPYAYTIMPRVLPDGGVSMPIITTYEDIEAAYVMVRGASDLLDSKPFVEIRGTWYTFTESLNLGRLRSTGQEGNAETVALFPSSKDKGITGELVWKRVEPENLGKASVPDLGRRNITEFRLHLLELHDRYIEALQAGDVEGVLATYDDGVQAAVRDYVADTGALVSLDGKDAHRRYYNALFEIYAIERVSMLDRVIQSWYVFSELRLTLRRRATGNPVTFHIAEFFVPARDGRFIARVGHGTDAA